MILVQLLQHANRFNLHLRWSPRDRRVAVQRQRPLDCGDLCKLKRWPSQGWGVNALGRSCVWLGLSHVRIALGVSRRAAARCHQLWPAALTALIDLTPLTSVTVTLTSEGDPPARARPQVPHWTGCVARAVCGRRGALSARPRTGFAVRRLCRSGGDRWVLVPVPVVLVTVPVVLLVTAEAVVSVVTGAEEAAAVLSELCLRSRWLRWCSPCLCWCSERLFPRQLSPMWWCYWRIMFEQMTSAATTLAHR